MGLLWDLTVLRDEDKLVQSRFAAWKAAALPAGKAGSGAGRGDVHLQSAFTVSCETAPNQGWGRLTSFCRYLGQN